MSGWMIHALTVSVVVNGGISPEPQADSAAVASSRQIDFRFMAQTRIVDQVRFSQAAMKTPDCSPRYTVMPSHTAVRPRPMTGPRM